MNTTATHCQNCGSTDPEYVGPDAGDQGYSACCNEPIIWGGCAGCTHGAIVVAAPVVRPALTVVAATGRRIAGRPLGFDVFEGDAKVGHFTRLSDAEAFAAAN